MDLIKSFAYMSLWGIGFIAVDALTHPFFNTLQGWIGGHSSSNGGN